MKNSFLVLLSLLFSVSYAQQSQMFKVITQNTNEPVAYAMVKVLHQEKGTLTTFNGEFSLDDSYKDTDTLKISCLGYTDYFTTVNNIKINSIIELKQKTNDLEEVVITAKKGGFKTKTLSVNKKRRKEADENNSIGDEIAVWFPNKYSINGTLKNIQLYISDQGYPDAYFRIHVYESNSLATRPGKEITSSNIIANGTTGNEWVTIDIEKENITINKNGCFIGVEFFHHASAKQYLYKVGDHVFEGNGISIGRTYEQYSNVKNTLWFRTYYRPWSNSYAYVENKIGKPRLNPTTNKIKTTSLGDTVILTSEMQKVAIPMLKIDVLYDKKTLKNNYKEPKKKYFKEFEKTEIDAYKYPQASITELLNSGIKAINNNDIVYVHQHLMFYDSKEELESISNKMKDNLEKHGTVMSEENKKNALNYFQYIINHMGDNELIEQVDGRSFILNIDNRTYTFATINGRWKIHASFVTSVNQSNTIQYQLKK